MVKSEPFLPSPPSETVSAVPLDSPIRTTPIHPDLPEIQLPGEPLPIYQYHPVTCQPLEEQEIRTEIEQLRQEFPTKETALRAQELAAKEAKRKIEEAEKKKEQVQKAIDKKVKERDTEMKVLSKYQERSRGLFHLAAYPAELILWFAFWASHQASITRQKGLAIPASVASGVTGLPDLTLHRYLYITACSEYCLAPA
ncbi:unnamed protein product [Penicillium manginii]